MLCLICLAEPGKGSGCCTNTVVIDQKSVQIFSKEMWILVYKGLKHLNTALNDSLSKSSYKQCQTPYLLISILYFAAKPKRIKFL